MTVGVVWEFIEFTADQMFFLDMQKDFVVSSFASVTLDESNTQIPVRISEITRTIIETKNGDPVVIEGGYIDTMKDLMVNFIGAIVFSVIGYFYEARNKTKSVAKELMIEPLSEESIREYNENIEKKTSSKGMIRSTKE